MALIICPECGQQISNQSIQCIHCGYPINKQEKNEDGMCFILNKSYNLSFLIDKLNDCKQEGVASGTTKAVLFTLLSDKINDKGNDYWDLAVAIFETGKIPPTFTPKPKEEPKITCPRCGSTQITTGPRGVSGFWGFIGASKTVNRCASCGKTWEP